LSSAHLPSKLRRAIGWIAIYALALQSVLSGVVSHPTFALERANGFDPAGIICLTSHDVGAGRNQSENTGQVPGDETSHSCGPCALCAPPPSLAVSQVATPLAIDHVATQPAVTWRPVLSSFSRIALPPGGPRAPPMNG
jgi:hypothetical protein